MADKVLTEQIFRENNNGSILFHPGRDLIPFVYRRRKPEAGAIQALKNALRIFLRELAVGEKDTSLLEPYYQGCIMRFLEQTGFAGKHAVCSHGRTDLAIHEGAAADTPIVSIIEVKRPQNKGEMVSEAAFNAKALHEVVAYAMTERLGKNNADVRRLIITNGWHWYVLDMVDLCRVLKAVDRRFFRQFEKYLAGNLNLTSTRELYDCLMAPAMEAVIRSGRLDCWHIDLSTVFNAKTQDLTDQPLKLKQLCQFFSPETLILRETKNDANTLNKAFYDELLYIMGLAEAEKNGGEKKLLITRLPLKDRERFSLIEIALKACGQSHPGLSAEALFEPALEVTLQWVIRVIFLKLLETQLVNYHQGDEAHAFLTPERIPTFGHLAELFFDVLAVPRAQREAGLSQRFQNVPYLNSGLFELTETEYEFARPAEGMVGAMKPFARTVLRDADGKPRRAPINNLEYLLRFLASFDFGSAEASDAASGSARPLINASVLGLVFEKINGYKEGAVYTPSFVTAYMARRTLENVVRVKLEEAFSLGSDSWEDLKVRLLEDFRSRRLSRRKVADVIDGIRICDPAVGSGHYLVSALNRLLLIKDELRVLLDENGTPAACSLKLDNDELVVLDENDEPFVYNPKNQRSCAIQKTLFEAKRRIIESSLYGVDVNPKSVHICQLRLWIELLKNAYYGEDGELRTLPNIDCNVRCGNSLVSAFRVRVGAGAGDEGIARSFVPELQALVHEYKHQDDKVRKAEVRKEIAVLKGKLKALYEAQGSLFDDPGSTQTLDSFEWMFEFPDVLDADGRFLGFDAVLSNPPYMRVQELAKFLPAEKAYYEGRYQTAKGSYDLANLFVERLMAISAPDGIHSFIFPHKFLTAASGEALRTYLAGRKALYELVHFGANQIFTEATTYTCIAVFGAQPHEAVNIKFLPYGEDCREALEKTPNFSRVSYASAAKASVAYGSNQLTLFPETVDEAIFFKIYEQKGRLGDAVTIFQGIPTSCDKLYILEKQPDGRYLAPLTGKVYDLEDTFLKPFLRGRDVRRYGHITPERFVFFPYALANGEARPVFLEELRQTAPLTAKYVEEHEKDFKDRERGKAAKLKHWFGYLRIQNMTRYGLPRLSSMEICAKHPNVMKNPGYAHGTKVYSWIIKPEAAQVLSEDLLLAIANSRLIWWFLKLTGDTLSGDARTFKTNYLSPFPIPASPDPAIKAEIEALAQARQQLDEGSDAEALERRIDEAVCRLYGLEGDLAEHILAAF